MKARQIEVGVGIFILLGLAGLIFLSLQVSGLSQTSYSDAYTISARFDNIGGLRIRAPVTMAGVKVGRVSDIGFDKETFEAVVELEISSDYRILPFDTSASILTAGLLGENYIGLDAGSDTEVLSEGDEVTFTQGALVLENLIGQFVASQGD